MSVAIAANCVRRHENPARSLRDAAIVAFTIELTIQLRARPSMTSCPRAADRLGQANGLQSPAVSTPSNTSRRRRHRIERLHRRHIPKGISMDTVKEICVIVPTVLLTAATVIGVATVI